MTVMLALVALGLATPYVLCRLDGRVPVRLVVTAHLAGMALVWLGVIDLAVGAAGLAHRFAEFCELALADPRSSDAWPEVVGLFGVLTAMFGRALLALWRTGAATRRMRHDLLAGSARSVGDVTYVALGAVAATVGLLHPRIFVDHVSYPRLGARQRAAVLAHERGHVRGRHGLIDLAARCMAAGLAPLPSARLSLREVRRHLEAMADDRAATVTSRRTVATAIVTAAATPPQPALGATGGSAWRVERLLSPPSFRRSPGVVATGVVGLSLAALTQTVGHALAGIHLFPVAFPSL